MAGLPVAFNETILTAQTDGEDIASSHPSFEDDVVNFGITNRSGDQGDGKRRQGQKERKKEFFHLFTSAAVGFAPARKPRPLGRGS